MKKSPVFLFLISLCAGLFAVLLFTAYLLSSSFIKKEEKRSEVFLKQLQASFNSEYRKITEEFYVGSYQSISMRIADISKNIGDSVYSLYLFDKSGNCVFMSKSTELVGKTCQPVANFTRLREGYRDPGRFEPIVRFDSSSKRYEYFVSLFIGSEHHGYLLVTMPDPYGFYRGSKEAFLAKNFLVPIGVSLVLFFVFGFYYWTQKINPYLRKTVALEKNVERSKLAMRMAHDIQAPLEVLRGLIANTKSLLPEGERKLLQSVASRIKNMSSDLMSQNVVSTHEIPDFTFGADCIDTIVAEKEVLLESTSVQLIKSVPKELNNLGLKISSLELGRILSNIINNSIDAVKGVKDSSIVVSIMMKEDVVDFAYITVADNGIGMDVGILRKVTTIGGTYGKANGAGIGLSHAREAIYSIGGSLDVISAAGVGTEITLKIPVAKVPRWLRTKLVLSKNEKIVIIEDDAGFGALLMEKFANFECVLLKDPSEFHPEHYPPSSCTYFVDYEYRGTVMNGIDLIKSYALGRKAILTTSYFNEPAYQREIIACEATILPKFLAAELSVECIQERASSDRKSICIIDDDELVRLSWKFCADQVNMKLKAFDSVEAFEQANPDIDSLVFFDNNFNGHEMGLDIARKLHTEGYQHLYMVTGDVEKFRTLKIPHIKAVLGKEFPPFLTETS